jgi:hypothetical protein
MRAICRAHLMLLDLITLTIFVETTSYEALHYAVFSSFSPLSPSQVPVFSFLFFSYCGRPSSIGHTNEIVSSVYFSLYVLKETGRQSILN